jgi:hypothetical protein
VEPAVNRQGWVNVPCTSTVKWTGPWCCQEEGKVFCCANTLVTKTERGNWFLNRVTSTETLRYVPIVLTSVSCGTSKRYISWKRCQKYQI